MKEWIGKHIILDGKLIDNQDTDLILQATGFTVYEVFRIIKRVPLFIDDHIDRFENSTMLTGYRLPYTKAQIKNNIYQLIDSNLFEDANIKLILNFPDKTSQEGSVFGAYFIEHQYPSKQDFEFGVTTFTLATIRQNPNAKIVNQSLRESTNQLKERLGIYEVLLIDSSHCITEGSRSNVFFIRQGHFYTPPLGAVLPGVTRKYVLQAINKLKFPFTEQPMPMDKLPDIESVFITGTSRKALPVNRIDDIPFDVGNQFMREIMHEFDRIVENYLYDHQSR